jgi:cytochrome o ubiquinol oxidase operon protein cyoD
MSKDTEIIISEHNTEHGTLMSYVIGFVSSVALTLTAYLLVVHRSLSHKLLISVIVALALAQFAVQLLFFLHLGRETKPRWKLFVFLFMVMVVLILVFGSLWIMNNLNYRMTPEQINTYMNNQGGGF